MNFYDKRLANDWINKMKFFLNEKAINLLFIFDYYFTSRTDRQTNEWLAKYCINILHSMSIQVFNDLSFPLSLQTSHCLSVSLNCSFKFLTVINICSFIDSIHSLNPLTNQMLIWFLSSSSGRHESIRNRHQIRVSGHLPLPLSNSKNSLKLIAH